MRGHCSKLPRAPGREGDDTSRPQHPLVVAYFALKEKEEKEKKKLSRCSGLCLQTFGSYFILMILWSLLDHLSIVFSIPHHDHPIELPSFFLFFFFLPKHCPSGVFLSFCRHQSQTITKGHSKTNLKRAFFSSPFSLALFLLARRFFLSFFYSSSHRYDLAVASPTCTTLALTSHRVRLCRSTLSLFLFGTLKQQQHKKRKRKKKEKNQLS